MGSSPQIDCRFFSGYKPCVKNIRCDEQCAHKDVATPRILVIHLEALGAVLRATSILPAIKRKFPKSHITWITSPLASELLKNNSLIDRLIPNHHNGILALRTLVFDFGFCIDKSHEAAGILEIPKYIGESRGFGVQATTGAIIPLNIEAERLWELGLSNHEKFLMNKNPETRLITEALGFEWQQDEYVFDFSKEETDLCKNLRTDMGISKTETVIGLNTGCSGMLPHKKLTVEGWVKLTIQMSERFSTVRFLLLGGPEDTERNLEIKNKLMPLGERVLLTPTTDGLRKGMSYVSMTDLVVTGDSLGMHMAIALKKYVVAWFGPSCLHEIDFYGRGEGIKTESPCAPCWKRECSKPLMCYNNVSFDKLIAAVERGLLASKKEKQPVSKRILQVDAKLELGETP
jgi:heptosyltransferase-2